MIDPETKEAVAWTPCRFCGDLTQFMPRIVPADEVVCNTIKCQEKLANEFEYWAWCKEATYPDGS